MTQMPSPFLTSILATKGVILTNVFLKISIFLEDMLVQVSGHISSLAWQGQKGCFAIISYISARVRLKNLAPESRASGPEFILPWLLPIILILPMCSLKSSFLSRRQPTFPECFLVSGFPLSPDISADAILALL